MKEGWKLVKLEDVCKFSSGFAFKSNKFTEEGEPIIRISDIQNDKVDDTGVVFFDPKDYDQDLSRYIIYPNDILIAMSGGTTGKIGINKTGKKFYLNQRVGVFREDKAVLDHTFLFHYLHTKSEEGLRIAAGAAQPNLSSAQIKNYIIPLPPLSEQQSIVAHLDASFAEIDALKAKAAEEVTNAKAMFDAALREEMTPKEGWEEYNLVEELKLKSGDNLTAKKQKTGSIPVYGGNGITGYHNESNLTGPQILIGRVGALCGNIHFTNEDIWVTDNAFIVTGKRDNWDIKFLVYELQFMNLNQYASQTAQPVISNKSMKDVNLYLPSIETQQRIVAKLDTLRSHLTELEQKYNLIAANCDALKQAILRETFE